MYRCTRCQKVVPPHVKAHRIVLETRPRRYSKRESVNHFKNRGKTHITDDPGGRGREIVREVVVCPACANAHDAMRE